MSDLMARRRRGQTAYHSGAAAELSVSRKYQDLGYHIAHNRWRGKAGEIDLIFRKGDTVIFVEVKKSRDFDRAACRVGAPQIRRIVNSACEFLAGEASGQLTDSRFDVALVDQAGGIQIIENAFGTE